MKKTISDSILKHYSTLFDTHGVSSKSIGWLNGRQSIRFSVICQVGDLDNSTILDVGCGFGDLYGYLKHKKIKMMYHGVDINSKFIDIAKKRYSKASFEVRDIQKEKFSRHFDWVVATGITNHASTYPHLKEILKEMFHICKKGVAIDFISTYVDYKDKEIFYTSPEKILSFAKELTRRVTLRHDYMPFEFTLYLYKDDGMNKKHVFNEYYQSLTKTEQGDSWLGNIKKK
ncbi:MAG: class I SAM-dependent methyltransferase [Nitrosotalea sp.]